MVLAFLVKKSISLFKITNFDKTISIIFTECLEKGKAINRNLEKAASRPPYHQIWLSAAKDQSSIEMLD